MTEKQKKILESFRKTTSVNEVKKTLKYPKKEIENAINTLYIKKELIRIKKGHYMVRGEEVPKITSQFKPLEIKELGKLDEIPQKLWEYIWQNRKVRCSKLKQITGIPRFYIRQYIFKRKLEEFPGVKIY